MGSKTEVSALPVMSALPYKVDINSRDCDVRFVPKTGSGLSLMGNLTGAAGAFQERVGQNHVGSVGNGQQSGNRDVVERTPIEHLLDDGVGAMHAMVGGPDPTAAAFRSFA